jgi:hypothetical protein
VTSYSSRVLLAALVTASVACAGPTIDHEPDFVDVTLSAPPDEVRAAVIQVLTADGYDVDQADDETLTTGYREETRGPWDGLLRWRFGTGRSRVDAVVTAADAQTSRLRLQVYYEGKDGLFTRWEESPTPLPQSADNQLRIIKNALHLL